MIKSRRTSIDPPLVTIRPPFETGVRLQQGFATCKMGRNDQCAAKNFDHSCPLWVKSRHSDVSERCPLYPQYRTWIGTVVMSALCQKQTFCAAVKISLFDYLVGELLQLRRYVEAERLGGLAVDQQFDFRGSLHWQIFRLFSLEYLGGVSTDKTIRVRYIGTVTDQPARSSKPPILVDRRHGVL